jgi:hypothetical protein
MSKYWHGGPGAIVGVGGGEPLRARSYSLGEQLRAALRKNLVEVKTIMIFNGVLKFFNSAEVFRPVYPFDPPVGFMLSPISRFEAGLENRSS